MCGIALIFNKAGKPCERAAISEMVSSLRHRGPDEEGVWLQPGVALGHSRLSIVDIKGGHQPLLTGDQRFVIIFNGEIYNYQILRRELEGKGVVFTTHSDTEVVLQLYRLEGENCVHKLRGMFAFAVYDAERRSLFVARDRLGIKPVFYHWDGDTLALASEAKALFASGLVRAEFDRASVANYFTYQFAIAPHTLFKGIRELPPGYSLSIRQGGDVQLHRYWDLQFPKEGEYESMDEAFWLDRFEQALSDAAACHTIGEVPIGAYLSGGIDSSALAYLLTKHYPQRLQTFSIHFTNPDHDESPQYKAIASHLGVANRELILDDDRPQGYLDEFIRVLYHLEQPQRMAVDIPHFMLSGLVQANRYKVVYTGDGADELFGGYDCYRQDHMRSWSNDQQHTPEQREQVYLQEYTQWFAEDHMRMLLGLHDRERQLAVIDRYGCYPAWYDFWQITSDLLGDLFTEPDSLNMGAQQMDQLVDDMRPVVQDRHMLNQSLYIESKTRLPGWILWKSDRLSMAHSVEARVPFMDHPLAELAAQMPPYLKLQGMNEKYALKQLMFPHLPSLNTEYKKRAFYTPIRQWFFTPERWQALSTYMSPQALMQVGLFKPESVHRLYQELQELGEPRDMNGNYQIMRREWLLLTVLSVQILYRLFVAPDAVQFRQQHL